MTDPVKEEVLAMSEAELDAFLDSIGVDFPTFSARLDADIERALANAPATERNTD